jgi:hypothetical protein
MTGTDRISLLSLLIEIIIAAGALFLTVKTETVWPGSCRHVLTVGDIRSLADGDYPVPFRD